MIEIPPASPYAFGASLSACGERLLVGAPYRDFLDESPPPTASLYTRANGAWSLAGQVSAAEPSLHEGFARSVALAGDGFVIGSPGHENGDAPVSGFDLQLRRRPLFDSPERLHGDLFAELGVGLSFDGTRVFVGAPLQGAGAVYLFEASGVTILRGATPGFGRAVAIDGDVLVIGASWSEQVAGGCHVYRRDGSERWIEHAHVSGTVPGAGFGAAVAVSGDRFVVGAPGRADIARVASGRVVVYELTPGGCREVATFQEGASFGAALALSGERLAIGQPMFGADQLGRVGLVELPNTAVSWLTTPSAKRYARLGAAVALGPDYVACGMPGLGNPDRSGRVIVDAF